MAGYRSGPVYRISSAAGRSRHARALVVGIGRAPYIPAPSGPRDALLSYLRSNGTTHSLDLFTAARTADSESS